MRGERTLSLEPSSRPKVLLLGKGILCLAQGKGWSDLLDTIRTSDLPEAVLKDIPYSMQPEALCGTDIESIRKAAAEKMRAAESTLTPQLERLLGLGVDCILTTNYSYEPETILRKRPFNESQRRKAVRTFGDSRRRINL